MSWMNKWEGGQDAVGDKRIENALTQNKEFLIDYLRGMGLTGFAVGDGDVWMGKAVHVGVVDPDEDTPKKFYLAIDQRSILSNPEIEYANTIGLGIEYGNRELRIETNREGNVLSIED